jgi:hypothetical protein
MKFRTVLTTAILWSLLCVGIASANSLMPELVRGVYAGHSPAPIGTEGNWYVGCQPNASYICYEYDYDECTITTMPADGSGGDVLFNVVRVSIVEETADLTTYYVEVNNP